MSSVKFYTTNSPAGTTQKNRNLPVSNEVDICVLGGSCTGVFAAVRAARLGAKVALIEKQNTFGGMATAALVNIWHSLYNTEGTQQIISGLTEDIMQRLEKYGAVNKADKKTNPSRGFTFNPNELKIELDELVLEHNITPYLHTLFSEPYMEHGKLKGVVIDNKDGRSIIKAQYFIDATGDGDLCHRLGLDTYTTDLLQPPSTCALFENWDTKDFIQLFKKHGEEFNIPSGFVWGQPLPSTDTYMLAGTRVFGVDCSKANELTSAEIEGRRQIRAIMNMFRKYAPEKIPALVGLPSNIGVRETRHVKCQYHITGDDALYGKTFGDAIANGSYRLDIHHQDKPGITLRYLNGEQHYCCPGKPQEESRWREELKVDPTFYQIPLRSLIPPKIDNLMIAGRMLDASSIAFSGIRVMVNMNQLGEAAGVTSYLALNANKAIKDVSSDKVRSELKKGGSIII